MLHFCLIILALMSGGVPELMTAGDDAFTRIDYRAALGDYRSALAVSPDDPEILWRLARACVCEGEVTDRPERDSLFEEGERSARRCIAVDSLNAQGHTWLAAVLGYRALEEGMSKQVLLSRELHHEALKAIDLDPRDDAAYSILGSFYRALGNAGWVKRTLASIFVGSVPEGGYDEAEAALKKAVALAPDVMRHKYELGILYLDMGRNDDGRKILEEAVQLPMKVAIDRPRLEKIKVILLHLNAEK